MTTLFTSHKECYGCGHPPHEPKKCAQLELFAPRTARRKRCECPNDLTDAIDVPDRRPLTDSR